MNPSPPSIGDAHLKGSAVTSAGNEKALLAACKAWGWPAGLSAVVAGVGCLLAARLAKWPPAAPAGGRSPSGSQATPSGMSAALGTCPVKRSKRVNWE